MASTNSFLEAVKGRRSHYALHDKPSIRDERIQEILETALLNCPSAFNNQTTRLVCLLKDQHKKFWDMVMEVLEHHMKPETRKHTEDRVKMFRAAYGTVLFFEDPEAVNKSMHQFPRFADKFDQWSEHTDGMHQYMLWTAFDAEGLGCNLQHYNPIIDQRAQQEWNIPRKWRMKAHLVFGGRVDPRDPEPKPKNDLSKSLFIHGM